MPRPERRRALVTGCAGFIGSALCEALVHEGWRVTGVDAFTDSYPRGDKEANLAALAGEAGFHLVEADLAGADLAPLLAGAPVVVHLAGRPGVRSSFGSGLAACRRDNVLATRRLMEGARLAGVPRLVWASSSSVYGEGGPGPAREDRTPARPVSPYGVSKLACEELGRRARERGLCTVGMRFFTVFGRRQRPDMALRRMCEAACGGPAFPLHGDGSQARDMTHVDDAVDAVLRALAARRPAPLYNVGGGRSASVREALSIVSAIAGAPVPVVPAGPAPGDVRRSAADTALARRDLGWRPRVGLAAGLAGELSWVRGLARPHRPTAAALAASSATASPTSSRAKARERISVPTLRPARTPSSEPAMPAPANAATSGRETPPAPR
jgi:nucleoside-diphosphate-sugar epimerase